MLSNDHEVHFSNLQFNDEANKISQTGHCKKLKRESTLTQNYEYFRLSEAILSTLI